MSNYNRQEFLKIGSLAMLYTIMPNTIFGNYNNKFKTDDNIMQRLIVANEKLVAGLLETVKPTTLIFSRKIGYDIAAIIAGYCCFQSKYYHDNTVIKPLDVLIEFLEKAQTEDGTLSIGNLESPPDTAFLIEILGAAISILIKDNSPATNASSANLKKIIIKSANALSTGGVHTPNHRWVICAALAQVYEIFPDKKYINRINEWLSEGVFVDADGHFPERSGTYSSVETNAFISIARFVNKPYLLDVVRKNLNMYFYYFEPNGEIVSNDSRRQDQYAPRSGAIFYIQYRYMAIKENNPFFAAIASMLESAILFDKEVTEKSLFYFLENETLQKPLPTLQNLPSSYEKLFTTSHLLRIKQKNTTATLFGGIDWPLLIASGRSCSPNIFSYRKGSAVLKYLRLSSGFFSMGYFYSQGIKKQGNSYILHKKLTAPYYQPLPNSKKNSSGNYKLSQSTDGRFWNKMDFENRPLSNVKTLETTVVLTEINGEVDLKFIVTGLVGVEVTIELCFAEGGNLSGVLLQENDNYFLQSNNAVYQMNGDTITVGPGIMAHKNITNLEGEKYSTHFGTLRTKGMHVYLTGITPFEHTLHFS